MLFATVLYGYGWKNETLRKAGIWWFYFVSPSTSRKFYHVDIKPKLRIWITHNALAVLYVRRSSVGMPFNLKKNRLNHTTLFILILKVDLCIFKLHEIIMIRENNTKTYNWISYNLDSILYSKLWAIVSHHTVLIKFQLESCAFNLRGDRCMKYNMFYLQIALSTRKFGVFTLQILSYVN